MNYKHAFVCTLCARAGILQYLHCPSARQSATDVFTIPSKDVIRKFINRLVTRLDPSSCGNSPTDAGSSGDAADPATNSHDDQPSMSIQQQLENVMRQSVELTPVNQAKDVDKKLDASIKAEMAVFDSSGKRGRCLEQVYKYLLSVPPTSVEAERAFSAAGALCTKLRSRLSDSTLDTLCFLRSYYRN